MTWPSPDNVDGRPVNGWMVGLGGGRGGAGGSGIAGGFGEGGRAGGSIGRTVLWGPVQVCVCPGGSPDDVGRSAGGRAEGGIEGAEITVPGTPKCLLLLNRERLVVDCMKGGGEEEVPL